VPIHGVSEPSALGAIYDDTSSDVLRLVGLVLHRASDPDGSLRDRIALATYVAVADRIGALGGGAPDRSWVLSTAHGLARQAIAGPGTGLVARAPGGVAI
jgi:hypothetical protein